MNKIIFIIFINVIIVDAIENIKCENEKCNNLINEEYKNELKEKLSITINKLNNIDEKLNIIIKYKGMNKTNEEIKQDIINVSILLISMIVSIIISVIIFYLILFYCC